MTLVVSGNSEITMLEVISNHLRSDMGRNQKINYLNCQMPTNSMYFVYMPVPVRQFRKSFLIDHIYKFQNNTKKSRASAMSTLD
jgi:hypothetical protein